MVCLPSFISWLLKMLVHSHSCISHSLPSPCRVLLPSLNLPWKVASDTAPRCTFAALLPLCVGCLHSDSWNSFLLDFHDFIFLIQLLLFLLLLCLLLWLLFIFPLSMIRVSPTVSSYPSLSFFNSSPMMASHILQLKPSPLYRRSQSLPTVMPSLHISKIQTLRPG